MNLLKKSKSPSPTEPTSYPNGTFIETEKGYYYIIDAYSRLRILNKRILDSWSPQRVVSTTEAAVKNYRVSAKMKFRNGSLIHNIADGRILLIVDGKARPVHSPDVLTKLNASRKDVISVSLAEVKLHQEGEPLE